MNITILGCGSSVGVPSIGCVCKVCYSGLQYNKRTRASALVEYKNLSLLIDASPDLRIQALNNNINAIDAVLFTHCHSDHCAGIGEIQAFAPKNELKYIPIYSDFNTLCMLLSSYAYLFVPSRPSTPWKKCCYLTVNVVYPYEIFYIGECKIVSLKQIHGNIETNGFVINDRIAYCTDVKFFPEKSFNLLKNIEILVLGCLRYDETYAHAHVDLCIEWIKILNPKITVLTHMSHDIDYNDVKSYVSSYVDSEVVIAYDGLKLSTAY
ncbi:MBL fold metallo-hydrolase [Neoehrlichia mikurensis]|uniref:MBL fold metallo-hydrolase n=1 Tax=Neoehrlichia mikurensis TaxID=89586 RepID=A0A9Q9BQR0_9RICK|nr:MBL fold metallo-hydrolase [Neoehrlichia mikurensis]QXK92189.1 MBL fold metallo-hydrolase [Neoehrlichia mikurensis]QXK92645.1 MBL fold metallo-hydrolase [Neoehrlichia mikurensis]QXK93882.1 MBL fold metallo-hydrolase [Neoehrlichia mikurensis]UTO55120.1 MBL fold metallo-hydrolase [Neoehrlichia mikurensis]UTO56040.1 MBL fold metallo-hydrolase [Neoehrlichia mikurensis]